MENWEETVEYITILINSKIIDSHQLKGSNKDSRAHLKHEKSHECHKIKNNNHKQNQN